MVALRVCFILSFVLAAVFSQPELSPDEYEKLDNLPGLDFVGFGYDARFDLASTALQVPIMEFSFGQSKQYAYPTKRDLVYRVPDEIYVRNVAFTEAEAYLYNTLDEYKSKISLDLGLQFDRAEETAKEQTACVPIANTTDVNCTQTSNFTDTKTLSIGATIGFVKEALQTQDNYLIENSERTQLFHVFLDARFPRPEVKNDLRELSNYLFQDNPKVFFKFIEKYGTHYVVSATMGGQVTMSSTIKKVYDDDTLSINVGVTVGSGRTTVSNNAALASANKAFSQSITGKVDFSFDKVDTKIEFQSTSHWRLLGGNSSLVNLLDSRNASAAINAWKQTITSNPVPVSYRLREISTLFDDPFMRQQVKAAVKVFLNFDTKDIVTLSNFQGLPVPKVNKRSELSELDKLDRDIRSIYGIPEADFEKVPAV